MLAYYLGSLVCSLFIFKGENMTYFTLQTILWLLVAFIIGLILGRWIKRLLCKQSKTIVQNTTTEHETTSEVSYTNTADKLALRSTNDDTLLSQSTETVTKADTSTSVGTAALGATTVGIAGHVASQALSDDAVGLAAASDDDTSMASADHNSQPNSSLDSTLAEGTSVIAGVESSNLRMIDGVGKKMEAILHDNGINTWKDLSMKSNADLRAVLDKYDDRYKGVELDGWVVQAALLADGKVDEIISLQKEIGDISHLEDLLKDT